MTDESSVIADFKNIRPINRLSWIIDFNGEI